MKKVNRDNLVKKNLITHKEIAITLAYIKEGIDTYEASYFSHFENRPKTLAEFLGMGNIELTTMLYDYAVTAEGICQIISKKYDNDFPGVYEYEVIAISVARSIIEFSINNGDLPTDFEFKKFFTPILRKWFEARGETIESLLTEEQFDAIEFEKNHLDDSASHDGRMYETFGLELEYVKNVFSQSPGRVWTITEGDGNSQCYAMGFHWVNRMGYLITKEPMTGDLYYEATWTMYDEETEL